MPARETAIGDRGMVASISPRAAAAGIRVLQDGGNAFDGTVATALEARGHSVVKVGDYGLGSRHQFILLDEAGILHGATDPRVPGVALGI